MSDTMKQQSEAQSSSVASQEELLKQLSKPEVQESLVTLLNQLPQSLIQNFVVLVVCSTWAYSSVGQNPRLITALSLVRVQVPPP